MTQRQASYNIDDILLFPQGIEIVPFDNLFVAISVETANWIVLYNPVQKTIFESLLNGHTIGEAYEKVGEQGLQDLKTVLAGIYARKLAGTGSAPIKEYYDATKHLNIYLTNSCNLRCVHCFMKSGLKYVNELQKDDWKNVLQQFSDNGGTNVTFTGGEPLMNQDFEEIVEFAHNIGLEVTVLSNGVLWTDDMIHRMVPYITEVQFSIDGVNEQDNAKVRGSNHFEKVVHTVISFANSGVRTSVATTFTLDNISSAEAYKRFIDSIKAATGNKVFFKLTKKILLGRDIVYDDSVNQDYYQKIINRERFVDPHAPETNFMEGHEPNKAMQNCGYGGLSIAANGNVFLCNRILELQSYGNVKTKPLKEFVASGKKALQQSAVDQVEPCRNCALRYICGGDCRIDHFNFKGKLQGWTGKIRQIDCDEKFRHSLLKRMVESYSYYYHVHGI